MTFDQILKAPDDIQLNYCFAIQQITAKSYKSVLPTLERVLLLAPARNDVRFLYALVQYRLGMSAGVPLSITAPDSQRNSDYAFQGYARYDIAHKIGNLKRHRLLGAIAGQRAQWGLNNTDCWDKGRYWRQSPNDLSVTRSYSLLALRTVSPDRRSSTKKATSSLRPFTPAFW